MLGHIECAISHEAADALKPGTGVLTIGNEDLHKVRIDVILSMDYHDDEVIVEGLFTEIKEEGTHGCAQ